jgi:hypothetical protein
MLLIALKIFCLGFLVNLLWEILHSQLYLTCLNLPFKKFTSRIISASAKDALWILFFYFISVVLFKNNFIFQNNIQLGFFVFAALIFSFMDEKISLKLKRWEYTEKMPTIYGVGISPLLELVITGIFVFIFIF